MRIDNEPSLPVTMQSLVNLCDENMKRNGETQTAVIGVVVGGGVRKGEGGKDGNCGLCSVVFQMFTRSWKWFM